MLFRSVVLVLLDNPIITPETFTALLLKAGRQHDADGAGGGADAGAGEGNRGPGEVSGFVPGRLGRGRMNQAQSPGKPCLLSSMCT